MLECPIKTHDLNGYSMKLLPLLYTFIFISLLTACGSDNDSNSNIPINPNSIVAIESSAYTNCARTHGGEFKCWGYNGNYAFANGNDDDYVTDEPEEVGTAIASSQLGDTPILHAETNEYFGCALYEDGNVKCWGESAYFGVTEATEEEGATTYTGDSPSELGNNLPIIDLGTNLTATHISLGNSHACAILNNGRVKCWGDGGDGRLGYGNSNDIGDDENELGDALPFVELGTDETDSPYTAKQIAAGWDITCALLSNDQIKCWGENNASQLGYGDFNDRGDEDNEMGNNLPFVDLGSQRSVKKVFVYYRHTCAILDNDALKCWGANNDGEIGLGSGDNFIGNNVPNRTETYCHEESNQALVNVVAQTPGEGSCELGGYQVTTGIDTAGNGVLDQGQGFTQYNSCNEHDINFVYAPLTVLEPGGGGCEFGGLQLTGDFDNNNDGLIGNGNENNMGDNLPEIDFGSNSPVIDVLLGDDHTCALLEDHTLKCWGDNGYGQAGLDTTDDWGDGENETPANRESPFLGTDVYPVEISGSYSYSCALLNNGQIKCWGYDEDYGVLGTPEYYDEYIGDGLAEDDLDNEIEVIEMGDNLKSIDLFSDPQAVANQ